MRKVLLLLYCISLSIFLNAQDEWTMIHPYPTLNNLKDAHFISENTGWVVGTEGLILYTDNGGDTWDFQYSNPNVSFRALHFVNNEKGWAVGGSNIYHTNTGGQNWTMQPFPGVTGGLTDVFFINPDTGWAVGRYQIVLKTIDGGESWMKISNIVTGNKNFNRLCFIDENNGIAVGDIDFGGGVVKITHDGGETWTETTPDASDGIYDVEYIDSSTIWICGKNGMLMKSIDGGYTWSDHFMGYDTYDDIHFFNPDTGILISYKSFITFDGGQNWITSGYFNGSTSINRFHGFDNTKGVAVSYSGDVFMTTNLGYNWDNLKRTSLNGISEIGFFDEYNGIGLSGSWHNGFLVRTNDGGYNWYRDTSLNFGNIIKMHLEEYLCCVINDSFQLFKTSNGIDWTVLNAPDTTQYWWDFQFIDENTGFLGGYGGLLFKTIDGGQFWIDISIPNCGNLVDLHFISAEKGWIIDYSSQAILKTESGGNSWTYSYLGSQPDLYHPTNIQFVNGNVGYATVEEDRLFKTTDGGINWNEVYNFNYGFYSDIYFINENEGWYKNMRYIYHTVDGGHTWSNEQSFGSASVGDIFFLNDNKGWICGDYSLVAVYNTMVNTPETKFFNDNFSIYPNPANDEICLKLSNEQDHIQEIEIFNIKGLQILNLEYNISPTSWKINISKLPAGTYIAKIITTEGQYSSKFIKK